MRWSAIFITLALSAGCAGAPGGNVAEGFPDAPYSIVESEAGALSIAVRTAPTQPPERGLLSVEYTITDAQGAARDGLTISVQPWMPEMGHGTSVDPTVEPLGDGSYRVSNLALYMPGRWELRTTIAGAVNDHVVVDLDVR